MRYWVTRYTALYTSPTSDMRYCYMEKGTELSSNGMGDAGRVMVTYRASKDFVGWVSINHIEELEYKYPSERIAIFQSPSEQDAAQYIMWEGSTLYNLCGEMCVCWIFGEDIHSFLKKWKAKPVSMFNQIISKGKSKTTGVPDLIDMASVYGNPELLSVKAAFAEPETTSLLLTPRRLQRVLKAGWKWIVGVRIERRYGELRQNGSIPHWIVVDHVEPDGINDGMVHIYNPFPDRRKDIPWYQFETAMGNPSGIFMRKV